MYDCRGGSYCGAFVCRLIVGYFLPGSKHGSKRGKCGSIFLQAFELIPQFHHGLGYHGFFVLVLALQIGQSNFCCLSVEEKNKRIRGGGRHQEAFPP